jgi:hypothetical protein
MPKMTGPDMQFWCDIESENNWGRVSPAMDALNKICGDREKDYGKPSENFKRLAERWTQRLDRQVDDWEAVLMLIDLKLSRLMHSYTRDTVIDIIGYACLLVELKDAAEDRPFGSDDPNEEDAEAAQVANQKSV